MEFEGRCVGACGIGDGCVALAVNERVLVVQAEGKGAQMKTELRVVAGAGSPNGAAILSLTPVEWVGQEVGQEEEQEFVRGVVLREFMGGESTLLFDRTERKLLPHTRYKR